MRKKSLVLLGSHQISQKFLRGMVEVQSALAHARLLDRANRKKLREMIVVGAAIEPGPHWVEIRRTATGHRLIVR